MHKGLLTVEKIDIKGFILLSISENIAIRDFIDNESLNASFMYKGVSHTVSSLSFYDGSCGISIRDLSSFSNVDEVILGKFFTDTDSSVKFGDFEYLECFVKSIISLS